MIDSLTQLQDVVIATGGGAVLLPENRERLAARGRVVYLKTGIRQQLERTRHGRQRPLLYTADPEARLRELMEVRAPLYESIASRGRRDRWPARARSSPTRFVATAAGAVPAT